MQIIKAVSKNEAAKLIESRAGKLVELDYADGWQDALELGKLGRQHGVAVMFKGQEAIAVQSMRALLRGLRTEKDTYRQRFLFCLFDITACAPEDVKEAESLAAGLGDLILPGELLANPYQTWTH